MKASIDSIAIKGFKSLKEINKLKLSNLNVLIGANGAGKSNFIEVFHMLSAMANNGLNDYVLIKGGASNFLFNGPKETANIELELDFKSSDGNPYTYNALFTPTQSENFIVSEKRKNGNNLWSQYGASSIESRISDEKDFVFDAISNIEVYHLHDTSSSSPMRRSEIIEDNKRLRGNASNIAPVLLNLRKNYKREYAEIKEAIRIVMPFFDDFILDVEKRGERNMVKLAWKQKGSSFPMQPYHLSDGSIRFIALATALLEPNLPSTIIIDEPELGLHPEAIAILAELINSASKETQVIIATQSPTLIDHFSGQLPAACRSGGLKKPAVD